MQQLFITQERLKALKKDKGIIGSVEKACNCKIKLVDDSLEIHCENGYDEFVAKNIMFAFGRGFDIHTAMMLTNDEYYFASIDLGQIFGNSNRLQQVRSRIIGEEGKSKKYIESVSGAKLSVYGETVSFIGSSTQINEAETAVNALIEGGTHKMAYARMEAAHRKNKAQRTNATF